MGKSEFFPFREAYFSARWLPVSSLRYSWAMHTTDVATRITHPWVAQGKDRIRFGLAYGPRSDWTECRDLVQMAEAAGFDSYWTMDHPSSGMDCWTLLSTLATTTTHIRLGAQVSCIFYRSPALLARMAADVDRISGGRLILGVGIGNHEKEFAKFGIPFRSVCERQEALAETLEIVVGLWESRSLTYTGKHFQVQQAHVRPGPVQQPHVPVLIAGGGEQVTLRQVVQFADVANFCAHRWAGSAFTEEDVVRKYTVLREHCASLNRNYDSILRSHTAVPVVLAETQTKLMAKLAALPPQVCGTYASSTVAGTPDEVLSYYQALVVAVVRYFIAGVFGNDSETARLFARWVLPVL